MPGPDVSALDLHGQTTARFNSSWTLVNRRVEPARGRECPEGEMCFRVTGVVRSRFRATVTIKMPAVPPGLTQCQRKRVHAFINTILFSHEREHRTRLQSYDGVVDTPIDVTGCWPSEVRVVLQAVHDAVDGRRRDAARDHSAAIDPFTPEIDLDCD